MIRTLQKKFTVTAMIAVTVLLTVLLGVINLVNAVSLSRESDQLLESLAMQEGFGPAPMLELPDGRERRGFFQQQPMEDARMGAVYFTVRMSSDGEVRSVDLRHIASIDEEEATALGLQAFAAGRGYGRIDNLKYQTVEPYDDSRSIVFLDVSVQRSNLLRVAGLSVLAGLLAWCAMLVLVRALSRRAIRPIAENMERQRQFVTDAGHELKTPLAIIQANLDAMELTGGENKYSRNIRGQTQRLADLTRNLLTLARIDEASVPMDAEELDLSALTAESLEMFRAPAELKGLQVTEQLQPGVSLRANRAQISQLLSILLDNAVKYASEGGSLSLRLTGGEHVCLQVANTVDQPVDAERIFDRFYRADSSRNQKAGGFGIGLSAARAIVNLYRGSITAANEGDTVVFTVILIPNKNL